MNWLLQIENELRRVKPGENPGRTRTIARRIAGIALLEYQRIFPNQNFGNDYIKTLRGIMENQSIPQTVLDAADRLQTRLSVEYESPSINPIEDAKIIVDFVKGTINKK
jgi:hypothetical protein